MEKIFNPASILVIGVSEQPHNLAQNIVANLSGFGWQGDLYLLGKEGGQFLGYPIHTEMAALPDAIDLAVILTPAATVPSLMRACIAKNIRHMVIESGGFSEFSAAGRALEEEIKILAARHKVSFVGPNGISIINRHNGLCLPFMRLSPEEIRPGGLSVISQSGGLALTYIGLGCRENLGVAKIISMGNKSNLDEVDYLKFLAGDKETKVIGLYLESMDKGQAFMAALKNCKKPVILHKSNTSPQSQVIAQSHTAALAVDDQVVDAACQQGGVFRVRSFAQFINYAKAFSLPAMQGDNLMVISRSGGHAVVAADAAAANGFTLPPLSDAFVEQISRQFRASVIKLTNPIDLGDIFNIDYYVTILEMALARDDVDGVLLNHVFQADSELDATMRLVQKVGTLIEQHGKPVTVVLFSSVNALAQIMEKVAVPIFSEPGLAIEALAVSRQRSRFLAAAQVADTPLPAVPKPGDRSLFNEWIEDASRRDKTLFADQSLTLLQEYGMPLAPFALARHPHELLDVGEELGYPLVLKAVVAGLSHKSDVGGVLTGISSRRAFEDVGALLFQRFSGDAGFCGVLVQKEVDTTLEMIVGARRDASFGDIFLVGLGGVYAEILQDFQIVPGPLRCEIVSAMAARLRGARILKGARGRAGIDLSQLNRVMAGLQALLHDYPAISEVEINPLVFTAGQCFVVDGRIVVL
ncbi:MAG: acetate--CoA ligase family protein [Deltaproteobacteria bacterium]|nr:acetate--CoA ligase family protein [Deltaproteobacteria bacterium]